jgi:hypothetical protein
MNFPILPSIEKFASKVKVSFDCEISLVSFAYPGPFSVKRKLFDFNVGGP